MNLLHPQKMTATSNDPGTADLNTKTHTPVEPLRLISQNDPFPGDSESLLGETQHAVIVFDRDFRYLFVNAEAERLIGRRGAELIGNAAWRLFPDEIAPYWDIVTRVLRERTAITFPSVDPERELWSEARCLPFTYCGDDDCLAVCFRRDWRLRETEQEALRILSGVADGFISLDTDGRIVYANPRTGVLLGSPDWNPAGRALLEAYPYLEGTRFEIEYARLRRSGEPGAFETVMGCGRCLETQVYPSAYGGSFITFRDITERMKREADARRQLAEAVDRANRDPLTGLLNHRAFYERLHAEVARTAREGGTIALALLDVDHFKFFNEAFGHPVGDAVLQHIANTLRACCRASDGLGRLGGDEFALIVKGSPGRDARLVVDEIRTRFEKERFAPPGDRTDVPLGCSMGVATFPDEAETVDAMVALADRRLSNAKHSETRRDTSRFFDDLRKRDPGFALLDDLVTAVDNRDRYTRKHSEDVVAYSQLIAERLGIGAAERESLRIAAILHDVGKIGIPDRILRRPSPLSHDDFEMIKKHPAMGAAIIGAVPGTEASLPAVLYHHEAWDGSGYPHGLSGEAIPLQARILAVADGYSAMITDRPYRKGMSTDEAQEILRQGAGIQWDAQIVSLLVSYPLAPE